MTFPIMPLFGYLVLNTMIFIVIKALFTNSKRNQAEKELSNLRIIHLESEQQQLIQQMQPHFLFNALSTLKSLIKNKLFISFFSAWNDNANAKYFYSNKKSEYEENIYQHSIYY